MQGQDLPKEDLAPIHLHFMDDFTNRLDVQLTSLSLLKKFGDGITMASLLAAVRSNLDKMTTIPEVMVLLKIYLVIPSTTSTAERSFSHLRRVKTYLRSTMHQTRLNNCMVLSAYKNEVHKMNVTLLINQFIQRNDQRRRTFATAQIP